MTKFLILLLLNTIILLSCSTTAQFQRIDREKILSNYRKYRGTPYKLGGNGRSGIDCSAFTKALYSTCGINLPRVSREQYRLGRKVDKYELMFGDLLFFSKNGKRISHVGLYLDNGLFIHSTSPIGVTKSNLNSYKWWKMYVGAKRIGYTDYISYLKGEYTVLPEHYFLGTLPTAYIGNFNKILIGSQDNHIYGQLIILSLFDMHFEDFVWIKFRFLREQLYFPQLSFLLKWDRDNYFDYGLAISKYILVKPLFFLKNITRLHIFVMKEKQGLGLEQQLFKHLIFGANVLREGMEFYSYLVPFPWLSIGGVGDGKKYSFDLSINFGAFYRLSKVKGNTSLRLSFP